MHGADAQKAVQYAQNIVAELLQRKIPLEKLVMTKRYNPDKTGTAFFGFCGSLPTPSPQTGAHVKMAQRMQKRDPTTAPHAGDRLAFCMTPSGGVNATPTPETIAYIREKKLDIDVDYYLKKQLEGPLRRLFAPVFGNSETEARRRIFEGPHMRKRVRVTPESGGILDFFQKKPKPGPYITPVVTVWRTDEQLEDLCRQTGEGSIAK